LKVAVISTGAELHANSLARNVDPLIEDHEITFYPFREGGYNYVNWGNVDVLFSVGFFHGIDNLFYQLKSQFKNLKIINQWIGTDIINTMRLMSQRPKCAQCVVKEIDIHCVDDMPQLGRELIIKLGIYPRYIPSIPARPYEAKTFPDKHSVVVYMPPARKKFYQFPLILDLAKQNPEIPFYLFAIQNDDKGRKLEEHPNVHFMGHVTGSEKDEWWEKGTIFINIPVHGGLPVTLIEALQLGRYAIASYEYPYTYDVYDFEGLLKKNESDLEASEYYRREYGPEKQAEYMKKTLDEVKWIG